MSPFPEANRVVADQFHVAVRSAPIAAHLVLAGHAIVGVRFDREQQRPLWFFEKSARPEFDRLTREIEACKAVAERAGARR
ncbi:MAG: hypothetical protein DMD96_00995 [Candidatus Rokuibacteriota bacterium]|nr:MAG: hypothetical protein DMD96_00995 [Candidatus Rokubacteria bacterium]